MPPFSVVINAGGQSSRMGADKALLDLGGKPMIERILEQAAGLGDPLIVTNAPEAYAYLGVPLAADALPGKGALGGLYTALQAAAHSQVLVLACDMPFLNRALLDYLKSLAAGADAVVPRLPPAGSPDAPPEAEPFRAVYSKACLGPIRRALDSGRMRMISFFSEVRLRWVESDEVRRFDPDFVSFMNCNTPGELEAVRSLWDRRANAGPPAG
jgi:molybdopterin-guanine dinucleotide biosynthesis protein A